MFMIYVHMKLATSSSNGSLFNSVKPKHKEEISFDCHVIKAYKRIGLTSTNVEVSSTIYYPTTL
jgi:hypothetical protein